MRMLMLIPLNCIERRPSYTLAWWEICQDQRGEDELPPQICLYANVSKHLSQELKVEHKTKLSYWKSYLSNQVSATSQDD